tara:strand:+ start:13659 stop:16517 length:2859 start_codon:yes stop_codon:yes gene_type:complete
MNKIITIFLIFYCQQIIGQNILTGKVQDKLSNELLIGANIIIKGTNEGTATNVNGEFTLNLSSYKAPIILTVSFIGYVKEDFIIDINKNNLILKLSPDSRAINEVRIIDSRLTEKQKESPLTVEAMDIIAIKETPSANFYDGLGALKGVDITAASLGFKIINTRGFNSTSPVRSLQIIDGVDNQAPGLNFSLGNFLGSSELDVMKVEIIQGASSAYYGPNAFNGVISMTTRNPFIKPGLSVSYKLGSRNLFESSFRLSEVFNNKNGKEKFAYKINFSYMEAYDWEANNLSAVDGTNTDKNNPGGYDAVNRYGDEDTDGNINDMGSNLNLKYIQFPGVGKFHRTGYMEKDIVDYNTRNLKLGTALHYKLKENTELIYAFNYGTGTTVYQGENRFSLKDIQFFQNRLEINQKDKYFLRLYRSKEDAGDSYDAVFTALKLQELSGDNQDWYTVYKNNFRNYFSWADVNWGTPNVIGFGGNPPQAIWGFMGDTITFEEWYILSDSVLLENTNDIIAGHNDARNIADEFLLIPGTNEFNQALKEITSKTSFYEGGTGFYDKSALNHIHGEYQFNTSSEKIKIGANMRIYQPNSQGSIFIDTNETPIINREFGVYSGIEKDLYGDYLKLNGTFRLDKNENYNFLFSPALSVVYKPNDNDIARISFSSAIRNPTLSDQYLFYNAGRAILIGNLSGHGSDDGPHFDNSQENMVTVQSLINYYLPAIPHIDSLKFFAIDPIRPEKTKSIEFGYRTTLFDRLYLDANYYYSSYTDFIGYKIGMKFKYYEQDGNYSPLLPSIRAYRIAANATNTVTTQGASLGMNYFINPNYTINANFSWNKINEEGTEDPIIPAYNTPEYKYNIGLVGRDIHFNKNTKLLREFGFSINYKWVQGFEYEGSPQFTGFVPTYDLIDLQISKKFTNLNSTLKLGASNLLDNKHYEVYGGPYIGRMIYLSILFELY